MLLVFQHVRTTFNMNHASVDPASRLETQRATPYPSSIVRPEIFMPCSRLMESRGIARDPGDLQCFVFIPTCQHFLVVGTTLLSTPRVFQLFCFQDIFFIFFPQFPDPGILIHLQSRSWSWRSVVSGVYLATPAAWSPSWVCLMIKFRFGRSKC